MSNEKKFKAGDVVTLKSGGPQMAVVRYMEDGSVRCVWLDDEDKRNVASFEEVALEPLGNHGAVGDFVPDVE